MNGRVQLFHDSTVPGPYTKKWREHWLRRVLEVQHEVRTLGPPEMAEPSLISPDEFRGMTRRAGVYEALEDCLKAGQFESEEEAIRIRTEQEARLKAALGEESKISPQKRLFEEEED